MRCLIQFFALGLFATRVLAQSPSTDFAADRRAAPAATVRAASLKVPVLNTLPTPTADVPGIADTLPIDLPTALRIANASSPAIALAQARVREALGRVDQAYALRLPTISAGGIYTRHDGLDQNRDGTIIDVSRSSLFEGGG